MPIGVESALKFLCKVKEVYGADSPQYQGFINAMRDFRTGSADMRETIKRVIALFQEHPELIEGYATFLPPGNTIQLPVDPRGNTLVAMTTGTMEIAQGGTVINETHTQASGHQGVETKLPGLTGPDKRLLENLRARIAESGEDEARHEVFMASFETYLKMPLEQRKASLGIDQGHELAEKLKELLGDDEFKRVSSEIFS